MPHFERVELSAVDWGKTLGGFPDQSVFQTPAWLAFLADSQNAEPVLAALREGDETLGYFVGCIVKKFGLRILGSPFRGWSTPYMGFNLWPSVPRRMAVEALPEFAFKTLGCVHVEVTDAHLCLEDITGLGFSVVKHDTLEVDLTASEEDLLNRMSSSCRRNIRLAQKRGVGIEEAQDAGFAEDFAAQLGDVFAKQSLVPHFGAERVRTLIKHLHPTGMLLLLRAKDTEGHCIGTGFYPAMHERAYYNGGASWRQYQKLCPNEALHWYAMRYWKKRGMKVYDLVGTMEFKQRFGGAGTTPLMIYKSKYRLLSGLRASAMVLGKTVLRLAWKLKRGLKAGSAVTFLCS